MGARTHDSSYWMRMCQFNSLTFLPPPLLLELLYPTVQKIEQPCYITVRKYSQMMSHCNLEEKHGKQGRNDASGSSLCTLAPFIFPFIDVRLMENKSNYKLRPVFQRAGQVTASTASFSGVFSAQISVEAEEDLLSHREGSIFFPPNEGTRAYVNLTPPRAPS